MNQTTLYQKKGRRYVKHDDYADPTGLPCGLYLFYKPNYKGEHSAIMNMMQYAKVHEIQDVGKFSDLFIKHHNDIANIIVEETQKGFLTPYDLAMKILAKLSEL